MNFKVLKNVEALTEKVRCMRSVDTKQVHSSTLKATSPYIVFLAFLIKFWRIHAVDSEYQIKRLFLTLWAGKGRIHAQKMFELHRPLILRNVAHEDSSGKCIKLLSWHICLIVVPNSLLKKQLAKFMLLLLYLICFSYVIIGLLDKRKIILNPIESFWILFIEVVLKICVTFVSLLLLRGINFWSSWLLIHSCALAALSLSHISWILLLILS